MKLKALYMLFIACALGLSASPRWFNEDMTQKYPDYYLGKGYAMIEDENLLDALMQAKNVALRDASTYISCKVIGETISRESEFTSNSIAKVQNCFIDESKITTELEIMGYEIIKEENDDHSCYTLIGIPKKNTLFMFKGKIEHSIEKIDADFILAKDLEQIDSEKSVQLCSSCINEIKSLSSSLRTYLFLNNWVNEYSAEIDKLPTLQELEKKITLIGKSNRKSINEISEELLADLKIIIKDKTFLFYPFEYENTGFVSKFGLNLRDICSTYLHSDISVKELNLKKSKKADFIFRGKLIKVDKGLMVLLSVENAMNEEKSSQLFVNKATCDAIGWENIEPENFEQIISDKIALYKKIQTDTSLKIEVETEKINQGPIIYYFGDEPKIMVRSNKSCYIRIIYLTADEKKILLIDNYPIKTFQANTWVRIPFEGVICEPDGVEQMIVQASVDLHPRIEYNREYMDDNFYVDWLENDVSQYIAKTRGIKIKAPKSEITEKILSWTIFDKKMHD